MVSRLVVIVSADDTDLILQSDQSVACVNSRLAWSFHTLTESALHKCVFEHYTTCMSDLVSKLLGTYMIVSHQCGTDIPVCVLIYN